MKQHLRESIEWPLENPALFERLHCSAPRGILLHGAPGNGKTLLARALAGEGKMNFLSVKAPEFFSKWVGESERKVRELFQIARAASPCIVFVDELDALCCRDGDIGEVAHRVVSQFLLEMDGIDESTGVVMVSATNRLEKVDPAFLRRGRFDMMLEVGPPNRTERAEIFAVHLRKRPVSEGISAEELAQRTEGFSSADVTAVCREAAFAAVRRLTGDSPIGEVDPAKALIGPEDFAEAIETVRSQLNLTGELRR